MTNENILILLETLNIESFCIEVEEFGYSPKPVARHQFSVDSVLSLPNIVECTNPVCQNGGASVGGILGRMAFHNETKYDETVPCKGKEKSGRICTHVFAISATVSYR